MIDRNSEAYAQSEVRLEAPEKGVKLWRNNVGVLLDRTGRPVRYGLANDTEELNKKYKSGDLIGWRARIITLEEVLDAGGQILVAQFVSRECKRPGWVPAPPSNKDVFAHEEAQRNWARIVNEAGGDAAFATGAGTL